MEAVIQAIREEFTAMSGKVPERIEKIPQSGGDRMYFRLYHQGGTTIATYSENKKETATFLYFTQHFKKAGLPVPDIYGKNKDQTIYFQQDFGPLSLLQMLEAEGHTEHIFQLFQKSLSQLARLQVLGDQGLDYDQCITAKVFGKQAILSDLLYFKYYFLDTLQVPYDKQALLDDFDALSNYLTHTHYKFFMFRDFQSRNIYVLHDDVNFIDYQGGMKGAPQYDVASLLWQAKAELSDEWKSNLLDYYMDCLEPLLDQPVDRQTFVSQYNGYVLIRLLQVLGAYGFRGLFERKAHFLASIPLAMRNLRFFVMNKRVGIVTPEFDRLLQILIAPEMIDRFEPIQANEKTPLKIQINSFSFRHPLPEDESGNGGGFVFDMRGITNPGRLEAFRCQTGKDKPVMDFLEQQTRMTEFLNSVWDIIDIQVEAYLKRDFENLQINFGCTGGQHRSVYAAEQTARHLRNKYKVKVEVHHRNQIRWVKE